MSAVAEAALRQRLAKLRKARIEMLRRHSPHSHFAKARSIDDVTRIRQWMQQRPNRRVTSLVHALADLTHSQVETRVHVVQQRRLSHPGWTTENRHPPCERIVQLLQSNLRFRAREVDRIAGLHVVAEFLARP